MTTREYLKQRGETKELPTFSVIKGGKYKAPVRASEMSWIGKDFKEFLERSANGEND